MNDIFIYTIGNLGSKFITFLIVPLYSFYISRSDLGIYDLSLATIFFVSPLISFNLKDGVFRFLVEASTIINRIRLISFSYKLILISLLFTGLVAICLNFTFNADFILPCFFFLCSFAVYELNLQIVRGLQNANKVFMFANLINASSIAILSYLFIITLNMGLLGIFYANTLARLFAIIYIELSLGIIKNYVTLQPTHLETKNKLLKYSMPLLPSIICWWLILASGKFFVLHFLGTEQNGIYALADKYSAVLYIFAVIFQQAWQETAIIQYRSADKDVFFSRIFYLYCLFLVFLVSILSLLLKIFFPYLVGSSYLETLPYIFILFVSTIFFALASFLELGYQCSKETKRIFPSIVLTAILNLALNYFLITQFQLYGTASALLLSNLFLFIYRCIDTKRYFRIKVNRKLLFLPFCVLLTGYVFFFIDQHLFILGFMLFISIAFFYLYKAEINILLPKFLKRNK